MTTSPEDLERDIEASRARLDGTLDRLQMRLNPSGVIEDALGAIRRSTGGAALYDAGLHAVRHNPFPVLLIAVGASLLLGKVFRPAEPAHRAEHLLGVRARRSVRIYAHAPDPLPTGRTRSKPMSGSR